MNVLEIYPKGKQFKDLYKFTNFGKVYNTE